MVKEKKVLLILIWLGDVKFDTAGRRAETVTKLRNLKMSGYHTNYCCIDG
jgi:hypothetical protein